MSTYDLILKAIEEEIQKCTPKYITALPYDLRTTDWEKLSERFNACKDELSARDIIHDKLKAEFKNTLQYVDSLFFDLTMNEKKLEDWENDNNAFEEADQKVLQQKEKYMESFISNVRYTQDDELLAKSTYDKIEDLRDKYFLGNKNTSYLSEEEQKEFTDLANEIKGYKEEFYSDAYVDERTLNDIDEIISDLEILGSNDYFNQDLPKLLENTHTEDEMNALKKQIKDIKESKEINEKYLEDVCKDLRKNDKEWDNIYREQLKTAQRMEKLGYLD